MSDQTPTAQSDDQQSGRFLIRDLQHTRSNQFVSFYANNAALASGFYDIKIIFGEIMTGVDGRPVIEDHAVVTMAWEHAKALASALVTQIETYEKEHGTTVRDRPA